ncbi:MAG: ferrochelatase, partial [Candidatus Heimdallarchaeota archaeon]|nr:ferrochelatase [Candidatus Heimdallarchaeota archaeon]
GSPIITITNTIAKNISTQKQDWLVRSGMRYGYPSIQDALKEMADSRVEHLVILPLFPQYSLTTSKTIIDKVNQLIDSKHYFPLVTVISDYHQHPAYIQALSATIRASWDSNGRPDKTVFSFHGVPQRYISKKGSPYHAQCLSTAELLANNLDLSPEEYVVSFQSRFGPEKWLLPNTKGTLAELGAEKVKQLDITCPGFAADCLETLEEINIRGKEIFQQNGGKSYQYIAALNHQEVHIQALIKIIETAIN